MIIGPGGLRAPHKVADIQAIKFILLLLFYNTAASLLTMVEMKLRSNFRVDFKVKFGI